MRKMILHGEITERYWNEVKKSANKRGIPFLVEPKSTWEMFLKQNKRCALSGVMLDFVTFGYRGTASLDRIDSCVPYTPENVQWTTGPLNLMKGRNDQRYFIAECTKVALHHNSQLAEALLSI